MMEGSRSTSALMDVDMVEGSLSRNPESIDTNDNVDDFRFTSLLTLGRKNEFPAP